MTEGQDAPDPEQDARLRALLADLGAGPSGERLPAHVAARLDDTLARLVAERGSDVPAAGASAEVVPLRGRWLTRAAVAAAAVVALGVAGVASGAFGLLDSGVPTADKATSGATAPESAPTRSGVPLQDTEQDRSGGTTSGLEADLPAVGPTTFRADVTRLLRSGRLTLTAPDAAAQSEQSDQSQPSSEAGSPPAAGGSAARTACPGPRTTDGATVTPIRYDGSLAVLVVHPDVKGTRLAEAWTCSGGTRLAGAEVTP